MYSQIKQKSDRLLSEYTASVLDGRRIGLEKESLRVNAAGNISQLDHPRALGSALTHPYITTDFSEALLEMVTPPCDSASEALDYLTGIHQFIVRRLPENEHIWNTSMPCILRGGQSVRIGEYGTSHSGKMKHAYRRGLGLRYGRRMQAIAGVHFNFSLPDSCWQIGRNPAASGPASRTDAAGSVQQQRTSGYFQMMQSFVRIGWLVPYLFGASPAVCSSFLAEGEGEEFDVWNSSTRYAPYGTSLRMGKIGYRYREDQPIDLSVSHTNIDAYIEDIVNHVNTEHPPYARLGMHDDDGSIQQLSTSRLQIENEFYSTVRPKQIPAKGELPIHALRERGIRYLELRSVDVNLNDPAGLNIEQIAMLEMLMIFSWLCEPQPLSAEQVDACRRNIQKVAHRGREPGLELEGPDGDIALDSWANSILLHLRPIALWLDESLTDQVPGTPAAKLYSRSLEQQIAKVADPSLTPSSVVLEGIKHAGSFFEYAQAISQQHHSELLRAESNQTLMHQLQNEVEQSIVKQRRLEQESKGEFDEFLASYLGQIRPEIAGI